MTVDIDCNDGSVTDKLPYGIRHIDLSIYYVEFIVMVSPQIDLLHHIKTEEC